MVILALFYSWLDTLFVQHYVMLLKEALLLGEFTHGAYASFTQLTMGLYIYVCFQFVYYSF